MGLLNRYSFRMIEEYIETYRVPTRLHFNRAAWSLKLYIDIIFRPRLRTPIFPASVRVSENPLLVLPYTLPKEPTYMSNYNFQRPLDSAV